MGQKITIDSASLANKGLEVMEAHFMYGMRQSGSKVLVHPQSIDALHGRVEDGSVTARWDQSICGCRFRSPCFFPEMLENPCKSRSIL